MKITIKLTKPERFICVEPREYPSFNLSQNISSSANRPPQIKKISGKLSDKYFSNRSKEKNALAISSQQSKPISSFDLVKQNYFNAIKEADLKKRPKYWGGYEFVPYEFEFWSGHKYRLNKRTHFKLSNDVWKKTFLQP